MSPSWVRVFLSSAAMVLLGTGLAQLASAFTGGEVLQTYDPVLGVTLKSLFAGVGALEIAVALVCLFSPKVGWPIILLLWLSASFVTYRLGVWWVGGSRFCSCLGTMTGVLRLPPDAADLALKLALAYLLGGSLVAMRAFLKRGGIGELFRI